MWSTIVTSALTIWNCLPEITVVVNFCTALVNATVAVLVLVRHLRRRRSPGGYRG
jgi:hypothetical protein